MPSHKKIAENEPKFNSSVENIAMAGIVNQIAGRSALDLSKILAIVDQRFQNVLAVDTIPATTLGTKSAGMSAMSRAPEDATPDGYALVNAVDELGQSGDIGGIPFGEDICFISRLPNLPIQIASPVAPIDAALVRTDGNDALVSSPETGLAVVVASHQATIVDSDGLHSQDVFTFFMSGVPEQNDQIDTYGQKLSYAQIACDCANLTSSGIAFGKNADAVLNLINSDMAMDATIV